MSDLVVTCPKNFYLAWIAEGDAAGEPYTGEEWGKLRGYAPVTRLMKNKTGGWAICRRGDAVAVTIDQTIKGFQGWRQRWWAREIEQPFAEWKAAGVGK